MLSVNFWKVTQNGFVDVCLGKSKGPQEVPVRFNDLQSAVTCSVLSPSVIIVQQNFKWVYENYSLK